MFGGNVFARLYALRKLQGRNVSLTFGKAALNSDSQRAPAFPRAKASRGSFRWELWRGLRQEVWRFRERVESERLSGRRLCQGLKNPGPVSGRVLQLFVVCSTPMPERYAI